ncbi:MAG TPA: type VI secretion system contractile sheath small subunit [Blastocatellia bacterium]|nr:type VI secretion system contractile sheath small subunit [Blastocatellia bacterium]
MPESTQHKLDRIRPPRVQITYDVEIGDAIVKKELPFVVGIIADLAGQQSEPQPLLRDRKFVEIDRDNFNAVLKAIKPRLAVRVPNKLSNDNTMLNVELNFESIDDFGPLQVLKQVEPMRKLFEARQRLADLLTKLDGNDALDAELQKIIKDTQSMQAIKDLAGKNNGGKDDGK